MCANYTIRITNLSTISVLPYQAFEIESRSSLFLQKLNSSLGDNLSEIKNGLY